VIDDATYISLAVMASMTLAKENVTGGKGPREIAVEACDIVDAVLEEVDRRRPDEARKAGPVGGYAPPPSPIPFWATSPCPVCARIHDPDEDCCP